MYLSDDEPICNDSNHTSLPYLLEDAQMNFYDGIYDFIDIIIKSDMWDSVYMYMVYGAILSGVGSIVSLLLRRKRRDV